VPAARLTETVPSLEHSASTTAEVALIIVDVAMHPVAVPLVVKSLEVRPVMGSLKSRLYDTLWSIVEPSLHVAVGAMFSSTVMAAKLSPIVLALWPIVVEVAACP
jgi:hypothetical protein